MCRHKYRSTYIYTMCQDYGVQTRLGYTYNIYANLNVYLQNVVSLFSAVFIHDLVLILRYSVK